MLRSHEYTTLAFLAQAIVGAPGQADEFVDAVLRDLHEPDADPPSPDLVDTLEAIRKHWQQAASRGPVTLDTIVGIAEALEQDNVETSRLAALALISAVQDHLARKSREGTLTEEERMLVSRLSALASASAAS